MPKSEVKFRTRFDRNRVVTTVEGPSKTKQSERDACDINQIMKRFERTGILPEMIRKEPHYGDFSDPVTYQEALNLVIHTGEQFAALPAKIRARFENDPEQFLAFCSDAKNADEMADMGLMKPESVARVRDARKAASNAVPGQKPDGASGKGEAPKT